MNIGIDIGGTNIRTGFFNESDQINPIEIHVFSTGTYATSLDKIIETIKEYTDVVSYIGIGIAGNVDRSKKVLKYGPNIKNWNKQPLAKELSDIFKCNVLLENDAVAASIGNTILETDFNKIFTFIWGTGVGGTYVEKTPNALKVTPYEIGHYIINKDGPKCTCGEKGCLETYIGGASIKKKFGVIEDRNLWSEITKYASEGIFKIIEKFNPQVIVFNGGFITNRPELLLEIKETLSQKLVTTKLPILKLSQKPETAGIIGAANLAHLTYHIIV